MRRENQTKTLSSSTMASPAAALCVFVHRSHHNWGLMNCAAGNLQPILCFISLKELFGKLGCFF